VRGFLRRRVPPASPIASFVRREPPQSLQPQRRQRIA
jgi:hypothetical protein